MLDDVRQRLRDEEVGGELDGVGQPIARPILPPSTGSGVLRASASTAASSPSSRRRVGWIPRASSRSSAIASSTSSCARDSTSGVGRVAAGSREPEREGERDEPLLSAVVEVALDPPPLGVGRGDDPGARRPHLGELRAHLGRQTLVLEHEPGRRANGLHERRLVEQRRIVNERGDLLASRGHQRDRPIRALRELERPAGGVDVAAVVEPIRDLERRVAEHAGEALAQAGRALGPQLDDEVGRLRSAQPRPDDPCDDAERDEQRDRAGPIVSSVGASSPVALTQTSQSTAAGTVRRGGDEQRRLRAPRGSAQDAQTPHEQDEHCQSDARCPGSPAPGRRRRPRSAAARPRARPASRQARSAPTS